MGEVDLTAPGKISTVKFTCPERPITLSLAYSRSTHSNEYDLQPSAHEAPSRYHVVVADPDGVVFDRIIDCDDKPKWGSDADRLIWICGEQKMREGVDYTLRVEVVYPPGRPEEICNQEVVLHRWVATPLRDLKRPPTRPTDIEPEPVKNISQQER